jgi:AcrR family transcriptional regulator
MPRRYQMIARKQALRATRQRIVDAAIALHGRRGVVATNWEEIAEQAGVSTATVYRHFPSLEELVPACARTAFEAGARLPTPEEAASAFASLPDSRQRLTHLIRASCHCYELGEDWLAAARREAPVVPALGRAVRLQEKSLRVLIRAATEGVGPGRQTLQVLEALIDFPFWKTLIDAGISKNEAPLIMTDLVQTRLNKRR